MTSPRCSRCGVSESRLYSIGIERRDGRDEGVHLDDHELGLCHSCVKSVRIMLRDFVRDIQSEDANHDA